MNDAEGLHKSRAGYFKLGRTGDRLSRGRGVNGRFRGMRLGRGSSSTSTGRAAGPAGVPPLREVGKRPLADSPRPLDRGSAGGDRCGRCGGPHSVRGLFISPTGSRCSSAGRAAGGHRCRRLVRGRLRTHHVHSAAGRQGAAAAGGAGVHTRCGDSSPHRLGVGSGGDGAGAVRGPPAFKFGQEGLGPALRGAREFGAGTATLAFPDAGRLGVGAVGGAGPRGGPRPSCHPGRSRTRAGGAGAGLGPAPAARGRHSPSSWSGGGRRAGDVGRWSGRISGRLKASGD